VIDRIHDQLRESALHLKIEPIHRAGGSLKAIQTNPDRL